MLHKEQDTLKIVNTTESKFKFKKQWTFFIGREVRLYFMSPSDYISYNGTIYECCAIALQSA